jgi:hypothetical protein
VQCPATPRREFLNRESEVRILPGALPKVLQNGGKRESPGFVPEPLYITSTSLEAFKRVVYRWGDVLPLSRTVGGSNWWVNVTEARAVSLGNFLLVTVAVTFRNATGARLAVAAYWRRTR